MSDENAIKLLDESPAEEFNDSLPHEQTCNSILNIINNNKNVSRKVILLSGVRGSGKTTIIQKLIKENEKDKVFITIDAWNAPEDVLKKEFLRCLYRGIDDNSEKKLKKKIEHNIKAINTIKKETITNVSSFTILIYSFIFIFIPIFIPILTTDILLSKIESININDIITFFIEHFSITVLIIIFSVCIFLLLFYNILFPLKLTKILFPFLYGSSDNYSEYEEGKDLTPYQFKQFAEKFYSLYSDFFDKDVIIVVDNMDRLSKDEEEKFISSLYTFIECMQKKECNINTWFILAVDKKNIGKNDSSVDNSFYDKLSPYEVSIPEMNDDMVNNFFFTLLSNELEYYDDIKKVRGIDNIILLLNFAKNNILDSSQYITSYYYTPRLIKKFVNQIKINYYSYINLTEDNKILTKYAFFVASLFVSSVQIFNNEYMLLKLIRNREKFKKFVDSILSSDDKSYNETDEFYKKITNSVRNIADIFIRQNEFKIDKLIDYINIIYYKIKIPDKNIFIKLIGNFYNSKNIENISNYFSIFDNDKLKENLNEAIKEVLQTNDNIYYITSYIIDIYNSLEKYNIIFLENNSITNMVLDKAIKINNNAINYNFTVNIFKFFVFSNNKNKYINKLRELLKYCIEYVCKDQYKNIDNKKVIFEYISFLDKIYIKKFDYYYISKLEKFDIFDNTLKDYHFLIDDGYVDLYVNNVILYDYDDFFIDHLNLLMIIALFKYTNNISNILLELNKNTINDKNWNLIFICCYISGKLDITEINNLIQIGINRPYYYIPYLIALDSYLKGQNIDNDIFVQINNLNSYVDEGSILGNFYFPQESVFKFREMNALIIVLNIFKDDNKYDKYTETIKEIIFYIFYNFHKNIKTEDIINHSNFNYILKNIIKEKYGENDEFYKALHDELKPYFKKLKNDFKNNINNS